MEIRLLGPFQVHVGGEDVTHRLSASGCGLLAALAASPGPVRREDLRRAVALASSSLDPQLSKVTSALGLDRPVHRGRWPRAGYLALDRDLVAVDIDQYVAAIDGAERAFAQEQYGEVIRMVTAADQLWRGPPFADVINLAPAPDPRAPPIAPALALQRARRRSCELAATAWLRRPDRTLDAERLLGWALELGDSQTCWFAATCIALDDQGVGAAEEVLRSWLRVDPAESAPSHPRSVAARLVEERAHGGAAGSSPPVTAADVVPELVALAERAGSRFEFQAAIELYTAALDRSNALGRGVIRTMRAETHRLCGRWDAAEEDYLAAAEEARALGDPTREAQVTLSMTRITWDLDRFGGRLEPRLKRLLTELPEQEELLRAAIGTCLAGGGYQNGEVDTGEGQRHARRALELIDGFADPLVAAQVLSLSRKALIDLDPPEVQLERSRRIQALGDGSADHRRIGDLSVIVDLLQLGRTDEARATTEAHRAVVERTRATFHRYHQAAIDAMWALYDGRWTDAAAATADADRLGRSFGRDTVAQVIGGQRLWLAYETGDADAQEAVLGGLALGAECGGDAAGLVWRCGAALLRVALGHHDEAAGLLDQVASRSGAFADVPRGPHRLAVLALASEVGAGLAAAGRDVASSGGALQAELERHPASAVLVGWPTIFLGSKRRYEGLAAFAAGDHDLAVRRLEEGWRANAGSPPLEARARAELALVRRVADRS